MKGKRHITLIMAIVMVLTMMATSVTAFAKETTQSEPEAVLTSISTEEDTTPSEPTEASPTPTLTSEATPSAEPTATQSIEPTAINSLEPTATQSAKPTATNSLEPTDGLSAHDEEVTTKSEPVFDLATPSSPVDQTKVNDDNITTVKSANWTDEKTYKADVNIDVSGVGKYIPPKKDIMFIVDNSGSMYFSGCYNKNHQIFLPYNDDNIVDGKFYGGKAATKEDYFVSPLIPYADWDSYYIEQIKQAMENDLFFSILLPDGFEGKTLAESKKIIDQYGEILGTYDFKIPVKGHSDMYIKFTAANNLSSPSMWRLYKNDTLYFDDDVLGGIFYDATITSVPEYTGDLFDADSWVEALMNTAKKLAVKAGDNPDEITVLNAVSKFNSYFTGDIVIPVPNHDGLYAIYMGQVPSSDLLGYTNPADWIIVDGNNPKDASEFDYDNLFDYVGDSGRLCLYHFDVTDKNDVKRLGDIDANSKKFIWNPYDAHNYDCEVSATVLERELKDFIYSKLQNPNIKISLVFFGSTVYPDNCLTGFTNDYDKLAQCIENTYENKDNVSEYGKLTNYEDAWKKAAEYLEEVKDDTADKFVVFSSDGVPNLGLRGDGLKDIVNAPGTGIQDKYSATIATISMFISVADYKSNIEPFASNDKLKYVITQDNMKTQMENTLDKLFAESNIAANSVVLSDYINPAFKVDRNELNERYGDKAVVTTETIDGVRYEKVTISVGTLHVEQTLNYKIPLILKEEYKDLDSNTILFTNADIDGGGLTTSYVSQKDGSDKEIKNESPTVTTGEKEPKPTPTPSPTSAPTSKPTNKPNKPADTSDPITVPTATPTPTPSATPTVKPTAKPSVAPVIEEPKETSMIISVTSNDDNTGLPQTGDNNDVSLWLTIICACVILLIVIIELLVTERRE